MDGLSGQLDGWAEVLSWMFNEVPHPNGLRFESTDF